MVKVQLHRISGILSAICILAITLGLGAAAHAQQRSSAAPQPDSGGPSGGGHRGIGIGGGLILQVAPQILNNLDQYDDEQEDEPRRKKKRRNEANKEDGDDAKPRPDWRRERPRLTAIPPIPELPPDRLLPPPLEPGPPPLPRSRAFAVADRPAFAPGEIVVMVRSDGPDAVAAQLAQNFNLILRETLSFALLPASRVYRFSIPDNRSVTTVAAAVATAPGVGFAAPNSYYWLEGGAQGRSFGLQYALPKMRIPDAQALVSGKGMTVAVIDSAVDVSHPSLKNADLTVLDAVKNGVDGPDTHGTAITGIITGGGEFAGIAPGAKIIAVRAFAPERLGAPPVTTASTLARAVDLAFARGARIFNMSFAGAREPLLIEMIDAAYARGAVFVAAAGNDGPDAPPAYPAAYDKVIAITATDQADALYDRANRGGYVLAAAPGVDIIAPVTGQGFDYLTGTSFAAAHVTGVIALLMERNPALTAETIRGVLAEAAHDLGPKGPDKEFGAGLADAYGSLMLVGKNARVMRESKPDAIGSGRAAKR